MDMQLAPYERREVGEEEAVCGVLFKKLDERTMERTSYAAAMYSNMKRETEVGLVCAIIITPTVHYIIPLPER